MQSMTAVLDNATWRRRSGDLGMTAPRQGGAGGGGGYTRPRRHPDGRAAAASVAARVELMLGRIAMLDDAPRDRRRT